MINAPRDTKRGVVVAQLLWGRTIKTNYVMRERSGSDEIIQGDFAQFTKMMTILTPCWLDWKVSKKKK